MHVMADSLSNITAKLSELVLFPEHTIFLFTCIMCKLRSHNLISWCCSPIYRIDMQNSHQYFLEPIVCEVPYPFFFFYNHCCLENSEI